jgi:hypothetical protein
MMKGSPPTVWSSDPLLGHPLPCGARGGQLTRPGSPAPAMGLVTYFSSCRLLIAAGQGFRSTPSE